MDVSLPDRPWRRVMWGAAEGAALATVLYLAVVQFRLVEFTPSWERFLLFAGVGAVVCAAGQFVAHGILGACAGLLAGALLGSAVSGEFQSNRSTLADHHLGQEANVSGITLTGTKYDIQAHRGRVVLVDFWATWCPPCRQELPHLKQLYERYHEDGFDIVGVSLDKSRDTLAAFVKEEDLPWPQIISNEPDERGWQNPLIYRYMVQAIPYTLLVDRKGIIVASALRGADLEDAVEKLMAGGKPSKSKPDSPLLLYCAAIGWLAGMLIERRLRQALPPGSAGSSPSQPEVTR
jgi:thiol-disulfide isomerase/thioredoxin